MCVLLKNCCQMACIASIGMEYQTLEGNLESSSSTSTTPTLKSLAKHLQFYKPPINFNDGGEEEEEEEILCSKKDSSVCVNVSSSTTSSREKRAAVLICIFEGNEEGELRVILTKRSMNLSSHPGEVALPGGKRDEGDVDDSATALREAMEEIGLNSSLLQLVAILEPFISAHLLTVVPVVALLHRAQEFKPLLNPHEVDAIFDVPLDIFLKGKNHRVEEREWRGWMYICHQFDIETEQGDFIIGGLTASILIRAASIVYQRPPSFGVNDHLLPDFQQLQRTLKTLP